MKNYFRIILSQFLITFALTTYGQSENMEEMEWLTSETEYEGLPLYLRFPNYANIWTYKEKYPKLICVTHNFENVKDSGLPTTDYNASLIDFDGEVVNLFQPDKNGIVILVETYGGSRNYWFYILDSKFFFKKSLTDSRNSINPFGGG